MPRWNLSSFDEFETPVLSVHRATAPQKRSVASGSHRSSSVKTVMLVAAVATISYSVAVCGNAKVLTVSHPAVHTAGNVDASRPPLEALFGGRFNDQWTREKEVGLLAEGVKKSASSTDEQAFFNFIHTAQHETLSKDAPRLTENEIRKLTRRKA